MSRHRSGARMLVIVVAAVFALTVLAPIASYAGSEGKRNTAIGLAGLSAYLLINGKTVPGVVAAAGAAYSYDQSQKARDDERYRDRYRSRYDNNRRYYRPDNDRDRDWNRDRDRDRDHYKVKNVKKVKHVKKFKKHDDNGRRVHGDFGRRSHGHDRGRR